MNVEAPLDGRDDASALRQTLVEKLKQGRQICTPRVEEAFRAVPRHLFVPDVPLDDAYRDQALITKRENGVGISSSSQPAIMAIMLEQLGLEPGQRVLEVGAGTGYNAALVAQIVGEAGEVVTVDLDEDTADAARAHLVAAGFGRVKVVCADGGYGYPDDAPYDRIILTVGAWELLPAWIQQLKPDGRIVLPLTIRHVEYAVAFERAEDHLVSVSLAGCGFMPLRGAFAEPSVDVPVGPHPGLTLAGDGLDSVDGGMVYRLLTGPHVDRSTGLEITTEALWEGLLFWLSLREPQLCNLFASGEMAKRRIVPYLFANRRHAWSRTYGVLRGKTFCTLMRPPGQRIPENLEDDLGEKPFDLFVRQFGPDESVATHLVAQCQAWDAVGRPGKAGLRIRAYPSYLEHVSAEDEFVVPKKWTRLLVDWK